MSIAGTWGTTPEERVRAFPCDRHAGKVDALYFRGISVSARPEILYRWLCQMRLAPYSYDWIDNGGCRSPQRLVPGTDELEIGQTFMTIFELTEFERNRHVTLHHASKSPWWDVFGEFWVSYCIIPIGDESCRLLVKLAVRYPKTLVGRLMSGLLPWGDLVMMRRQLLNFKRLSETADAESQPARQNR